MRCAWPPFSVGRTEANLGPDLELAREAARRARATAERVLDERNRVGAQLAYLRRNASCVECAAPADLFYAHDTRELIGYCADCASREFGNGIARFATS